MGFYILGYKQPHAAPPGAPRITRSRASPCPPAAPPDPAVAYIPGYMDGFQMWRSGSSRRPHSAAPVTPSAPKPRAPSQRSRHDVPVRPAVRFPPPPIRRPRQSLALCPSVRATTSRFVPPPALRRPCHAVRAKSWHSVPVFASRHPGSSRRPHSAAPSRRPRQSPALRPSVRVTTSRFVPPFALRRPCHAVRAKASRSVPVFASRHPGSSRRPHSAAPSRRPRPGGLRRLARCAPGIPRSPSNRSDPRFL